MTYYKIILAENVVGVGFNFVKWAPAVQGFNYCNIDEAQCIQDAITYDLYHTPWLRAVPAEAGMEIPEADAKIITSAEYIELYEELNDGATIPVPDEQEPDPTPDPEPEPEPEQPMTIQQMRDRIAELTALVMNSNEPFTAEKTYVEGEIITKGSRIYIVNKVIAKGETVTPGVNCTETNLAAVLNAIQTQS